MRRAMFDDIGDQLLNHDNKPHTQILAQPGTSGKIARQIDRRVRRPGVRRELLVQMQFGHVVIHSWEG